MHELKGGVKVAQKVPAEKIRQIKNAFRNQRLKVFRFNPWLRLSHRETFFHATYDSSKLPVPGHIFPASNDL